MMIGNILDNTTELYMIKYTFGEIFSSGRATLCKNPSDQTVELRGIFIEFVDYEFARLHTCTLRIPNSQKIPGPKSHELRGFTVLKIKEDINSPKAFGEF